MFNLSDFFTIGLDPAQALPEEYNPVLVVVSYLIASLGSYAFLQFAELLSELRNRALRLAWLAGGAFAMGCGIWAMHFVGMLAHTLPIPVSYDGFVTALSAVPAILAAGVALHVVARPEVSAVRLLIGGTLMGAGIGLMHYTGMAAMRLDALVRYDPALFAVSVGVAVVLAVIALQVRFWMGRVSSAKGASGVQEVSGALILGFAVTAMHYTAMASTYCFATDLSNPDPFALDPRLFATVTTLIAGLVLLMAIAGVIFVRRVRVEVAMRKRAMDSERRTSEQLVQAQKMEAVGQLTGGVAHDFNNILMLMLAHIEALRDDEGVQTSAHPRLTKMSEAVHRASDLVRQLLAFSRKQVLQPQDTVLNDLVSSIGGLLRRTLGEHIQIQSVTEPGLWPTSVDRAQVEAALLNLCVNARDAMPEGGRLVIETKNVTLDADYAARNDEVSAGDYVLLSVTDTGQGMPPETLARVFEPFFTTKEVGKGTGLGLSMVYGFIKQSQGHISIDSKPGDGTSVKLYFRRGAEVSAKTAKPQSDAMPRGSERILVVEDDDGVRDLVCEQVRSLGYEVSEAISADAALVRLKNGGLVDLVLTDVVMPGRLNGKGLADEVDRLWPGTPVVFMSGYAETALLHDGRLDDGVRLLSKPFRKAELARVLRAALEERVVIPMPSKAAAA
jgi:NO-binding membrane sensor protein with MHYT domain/nitrogen-specific signal transduction histidine kinase